MASPLTAKAQQHFKIGLLDTGIGEYFTVPFMQRLEQLGYVEGKNLVVERRFAEGDRGRLREFAADLVQQKVDIIVTMGTPAGLAAEQATSTIPIVLGANSDPVGVGLVASLARPGGNATGTSLMAPELSAKRLDILSTLASGITRFAILWIYRIPAWRNVSEKRRQPPISRTFCFTQWGRKISMNWRRRSPTFSVSTPTRC